MEKMNISKKKQSKQKAKQTQVQIQQIKNQIERIQKERDLLLDGYNYLDIITMYKSGDTMDLVGKTYKEKSNFENELMYKKEDYMEMDDDDIYMKRRMDYYNSYIERNDYDYLSNYYDRYYDRYTRDYDYYNYDRKKYDYFDIDNDTNLIMQEENESDSNKMIYQCNQTKDKLSESHPSDHSNDIINNNNDNHVIRNICNTNIIENEIVDQMNCEIPMDMDINDEDKDSDETELTINTDPTTPIQQYELDKYQSESEEEQNEIENVYSSPNIPRQNIPFIPFFSLEKIKASIKREEQIEKEQQLQKKTFAEFKQHLSGQTLTLGNVLNELNKNNEIQNEYQIYDSENDENEQEMIVEVAIDPNKSVEDYSITEDDEEFVKLIQQISSEKSGNRSPHETKKPKRKRKKIVYHEKSIDSKKKQNDKRSHESHKHTEEMEIEEDEYTEKRKISPRKSNVRTRKSRRVEYSNESDSL